MPRAEVHCHVLPAVDDGPATVEESLGMAALAEADGTTTVVATPHVRGDFLTDVSELPDRVRDLQERIRAEGIDLELRRGAELGHDMVGRLGQAQLETIAVGPPGMRWLLVETPFEGIDDGFAAALDELRDRGFGIALGHPERSAGVLDGGCRRLRRELARGAVAQVNAGSLDGFYGAAARRAAQELVARGLAGAVATDSHGTARPPALSYAKRALVESGASGELARRLVDSGPRRLLERGIAGPRFARAA
jgi:protein-tyrosine phosphatase